MLKAIDQYFLDKEEPVQGCLLALRAYLTNYHYHIKEEWKYGMPFYYYKGKMFCYLWTNKKTHLPYLGIVEGRNIDHPLLIQEKRSRMKILLIDPEQDLPIHVIDTIFKMALKLYDQ